ncbi:MAG: hypothetical protein HUU35_12810 [Armatimonadetes bacterium]|nr:hypothetical protein [Armatimonadota bacterium]
MRPARLVAWVALTLIWATTVGGAESESGTPLVPFAFRQSTSWVGTGLRAHALSLDGTEPFAATGSIKFRYGRTQSVLQAPLPGDVAPDLELPDAWSIGYQSDPKAAKGLRVKLNLVDVDAEYVGDTTLGFGAEMAGLRQQDYRAGWQGGSLAFDIGRDRLADKAGGRGLSREVMEAKAYGLTYRREGFEVDYGARFDTSLTRRLLGADGYNLAQRKLGDAKAGFSSLTDLGGLRDSFEAASFAQGDLAVGLHERRLELRGKQLLDRRQQVGFGGLTLTQTTKSLDAGFEGWRQTGYTDWQRLLGGREDQTAALLEFGPLGAGWTQTRLWSSPSGLAEKATITESTEQKLLLKPSSALSLAYRCLESQSGAAKLWAEDPSKLTNSSDTSYTVGLTLKDQRLTAVRRDYDSERPGSTTTGVEHSVQYGLGKRTKVRYLERAEERREEKPDEVVETVSHMQQMAVETAFGLSGLHERTTADGKEPAKHDKVRFERSFSGRYEIAAGFESWANSADAKVALAGYSGVMKKALPEATAYDWAVTVRPGNSEVGAWHRSLHWEQDVATPQFAVGPHLLTETGVTVAQAITGEFSLRGRWSRYDRDQQRDLERRELLVALKPKSKAPFIPSAEVGYRELTNADGNITPSLFASASVKPHKGLELQAQLARPTEGAAAVSAEWFEAEQHTVQLSATQALGKDGAARFAFKELPVSGASATADGTPRSREMTVDLSTPSGWLLNGLKLKGQYHTLRQPGANGAEDSQLEEHQAEVSWTPGGSQSLSASYRLRNLLQGHRQNGDTRLEFQYTTKLDDGEFALTGFLKDNFDPYAVWEPDEERYRFGFNFTRPF